VVTTKGLLIMDILLEKKENNNINATFWEIFAHSWRILWEKPKALIIFIIAVSLIRFLGDYLSYNLLEPYMTILMQMVKANPPLPTDEVVEKFSSLFLSFGFSRFLWGLAIPWLLVPWIFLATCRASLGLWDGYSPGLTDLSHTLKLYFKAIAILFFIGLYGLFLGIALMAVLMPTFILSRIMGLTPGGWILTMIGFFLSGYLFAKIFWPRFRRFSALQFIIFFKLLDGLRTKFFNNLGQIYNDLISYPIHMNQATLIICFFLVVPVFMLGVVEQMSINYNLYPKVIAHLSQAIFSILFLWPIVALSGFYRLYLAPIAENAEPVSEPQT
jgi:hypothetical protein